MFTAEIALNQKNSVILAQADTGEETGIRVEVLLNYAGHYRVSVDDCIYFLRDITDHQYASLFDNPFMAFLKELHEAFGTRIHLNLYYKDGDCFTLERVPEKYRAEWEQNADWLRLSFHAKADKPDRPYLNAEYDELKADVLSVRKEVLRFAGEKLWGPVTTLHFGDATIKGCRALRDSGYQVLVGDFNIDLVNKLPVAYYLNDMQRRHIYNLFIWKDYETDITFVRSAIIIDTIPREGIVPFLDCIKKDAHRSVYMDLLIHEQYFYPSYPLYQAEYCDKLMTAVQWAVENGYQPGFLEECVLGL